MRPPMEIVADLNAVALMAVAVSAMIGVILFVNGLHAFWRIQNDPQRNSVGSAIRNLIAGAMMITPATFYSIIKTTTVDPGWQHSNDAIALDSGQLQADADTLHNSFLGAYLSEGVLTMVLGVLFLVGVFGFIKGIYLIREIGQAPQGHGSGVGKVLTHLIGGIILMNTVTVARGIASVFFVL